VPEEQPQPVRGSHLTGVGGADHALGGGANEWVP
jgi:hypothetical protein